MSFINNPDNNGAVFQVMIILRLHILTFLPQPSRSDQTPSEILLSKLKILGCISVQPLKFYSVQVASQFNCLEFINPAITPEVP